MYQPTSPPYPPSRTVPRLVPHLVWEAVLAVLVVAVVGAAAARTPVFEGDGLLWSLAFYGLLASGLAVSLRTATPNLAVAGIAAMSGTWYAWLVVEADLPPLVAAGLTLVLAVLFGGLLGAVAGLTSAPAWAVSLAGLAAAQAVSVALVDPGGVVVPERLPGPLDAAGLWFAGFLLVSLAGAAVLAVPAVWRLVSANRTAGDPVRFGAARLGGALVGFVASSVLAGLAGLAQVQFLGATLGVAVDIFPLFLALGAVLIGGVSAFGGRGGIAGTALGVALLTITLRWLDLEQSSDSWLSQADSWIVVALAILVGLGVSRLLEAIAPLEPPAALFVPAPGGPWLAPASAPPPSPAPTDSPGPEPGYSPEPGAPPR